MGVQCDVVAWTWLSGSNLPTQPGTYGLMGLASPSNTPGGRWLYGIHLDEERRLIYLLAGEGVSTTGTTLLNDLWQFNLTNDIWTWLAGSNNSVQNPRANYGTKGVSTSVTIFGGRKNFGSVFVASQNSIYVIAGYGRDASTAYGELNDMWKIDLSAIRFTWMNGSSYRDMRAKIGPLKQFSSTSWPSTRQGILFNFNPLLDQMVYFDGIFRNQLWIYDLKLHQFAYHGPALPVRHSNDYGSRGVYATSNNPPPRQGHVIMYSLKQKILISFSGGISGYFNDPVSDLWWYNTTRQQFVWASGGNSFQQPAIFGTIGQFSMANRPSYVEGHSVAYIHESDISLFFGGSGAYSSQSKHNQSNSRALKNVMK